MNLSLKRKHLTDESTIGELSINGAFECFTLEDAVRPVDEKIFGKTAIPAGTYQVVVTHSPRFGRELPLIVDVPGFKGVRIHTGNSATDTEGCILVGTGMQTDRVTGSREAFAQLFEKIQEARGVEDITLEIA